MLKWENNWHVRKKYVTINSFGCELQRDYLKTRQAFGYE